MKYRIYYGDGSTYSGDRFYAPPTNVQVVVQENNSPQGFYPQMQKDAFYLDKDGVWQGCDMAGLWDYLMMYQGPKAVLFGRSVRDDVYWDTVKRAMREGLGA